MLDSKASYIKMEIVYSAGIKLELLLLFTVGEVYCAV